MRHIPKERVADGQLSDIVRHLEIIEILSAGLLLGRKPKVKEVAKILGVSDKTLSRLLPESKEKEIDSR